MVIRMDCLFCKIIKGELDCLKLYEDDDLIIILDAYPDCDGHTLIIPKNHISTFQDMPDDLLLKINEKAKEYSNILMNKIGKKALSIVINYGDSQVIKHYHMHLLPDFKSKVTMSREEVYSKIMGK